MESVPAPGVINILKSALLLQMAYHGYMLGHLQVQCWVSSLSCIDVSICMGCAFGFSNVQQRLGYITSVFAKLHRHISFCRC